MPKDVLNRSQLLRVCGSDGPIWIHNQEDVRERQISGSKAARP